MGNVVAVSRRRPRPDNPKAAFVCRLRRRFLENDDIRVTEVEEEEEEKTAEMLMMLVNIRLNDITTSHPYSRLLVSP